MGTDDIPRKMRPGVLDARGSTGGTGDGVPCVTRPVRVCLGARDAGGSLSGADGVITRVPRKPVRERVRTTALRTPHPPWILFAAGVGCVN